MRTNRGLSGASLLGLIAGIGGLSAVSSPLESARLPSKQDVERREKQRSRADEIAAWNAAVDQRKADKRRAKGRL